MKEIKYNIKEHFLKISVKTLKSEDYTTTGNNN